MKVFFISDQPRTMESFLKIVERGFEDFDFDYYYSEGDSASEEGFERLKEKGIKVSPIKLNEMDCAFFNQYSVFFSWHCRQIFPEFLVNNYRCINLHPSFNPYNRGWYPQVFSLYNGLPAGVTIHEMDAAIDMGGVIFQKEVAKYSWDTSKELHARITNAETELVKEHLRDLLLGKYEKHATDTGNINYKKDFVRLCRIDLNKRATYKEVIDYLRAFSFDGYDNAYFIDEEGNKVYIEVRLKKDEK